MSIDGNVFLLCNKATFKLIYDELIMICNKAANNPLIRWKKYKQIFTENSKIK